MPQSVCVTDAILLFYLELAFFIWPRPKSATELCAAFAKPWLHSYFLPNNNANNDNNFQRNMCVYGLENGISLLSFFSSSVSSEWRLEKKKSIFSVEFLASILCIIRIHTENIITFTYQLKSQPYQTNNKYYINIQSMTERSTDRSLQIKSNGLQLFLR